MCGWSLLHAPATSRGITFQCDGGGGSGGSDGEGEDGGEVGKARIGWDALPLFLSTKPCRQDRQPLYLDQPFLVCPSFLTTRFWPKFLSMIVAWARGSIAPWRVCSPSGLPEKSSPARRLEKTSTCRGDWESQHENRDWSANQGTWEEGGAGGGGWRGLAGLAGSVPAAGGPSWAQGSSGRWQHSRACTRG